MSSAALADRSAADLRAGFARGEFDPVEVFESVRARMDACEPVINAFHQRDDDRARQAAEASAERWRQGQARGSLDGVPVTIKENIARQGVPMPAGHAASEIPVAGHNAPITDRLDEAGAVILGSTTMPDWGMLSSGVSSLHGITRSPLNPALTTGGSSAGAGAAAAAGYGPIHIGSDIGGSIRLPATWLGLVGLKPSFGRIPLDAPYLGRCAGPLARRVADVRLGLRMLSAPDDRDYSRLPATEVETGAHGNLAEADGGLNISGLRVGLHLEAGCGADVDSETSVIVRQIAERFTAAGARVEPLDPFMTEELLTDMDLFWRVRSWSDLRRLPAEEQILILPYIRDWAQAGADVSGVRLMDAYHSVQEIRRSTVAATAPYDLIMSPVAPDAAFPAEWPMPYPDPTVPMPHIGFTMPFNMSEQPSVSVPAGYTGDGRTIGVQLTGRRFADELVLDAAEWVETTLGLEPPHRSVGV